MIDKTFGFLLGELNGFLDTIFPAGEPHAVLSALVQPDGSVPPKIENKIVITIINIERETAAFSSPAPARSPSGAPLRVNAPLNLNVYFLLSASFSGDYAESLRFLSRCLGFFQSKQTYSPQDSAGFPSGLDRLTIELVNLNIQDLQNLWATTGGKYLPSAFYKARMLTIDDAWVTEQVPVILAGEGKLRGGG
jgi:hypothetical protein